MKKKKSLLWGIILILCIGGGYGLYLRHQHNLNTPRTLLEMKQEAHWKISDMLWNALHIDDGFAKFSSPILVDSVRVEKDLFATYKMIRLIGQDTIAAEATVSSNKRIETKNPIWIGKSHLWENPVLIKPYLRAYTSFVNRSDRPIYVAAYEFDILKDTIAPSLPLPDPSSFEYNFVSAGDTNVYCLQNNLRGENLGILKTLNYTPDSLYVYIYDTTTFHQHSWKEIRQNKLYLDKLVLPKEQYEARMGHPLIVTYQ